MKLFKRSKVKKHVKLNILILMIQSVLLHIWRVTASNFNSENTLLLCLQYLYYCTELLCICVVAYGMRNTTGIKMGTKVNWNQKLRVIWLNFILASKVLLLFSAHYKKMDKHVLYSWQMYKSYLFNKRKWKRRVKNLA